MWGFIFSLCEIIIPMLHQIHLNLICNLRVQFDVASIGIRVKLLFNLIVFLFYRCEMDPLICYLQHQSIQNLCQKIPSVSSGATSTLVVMFHQPIRCPPFLQTLVVMINWHQTIITSSWYSHIFLFWKLLLFNLLINLNFLALINFFS